MIQKIVVLTFLMLSLSGATFQETKVEWKVLEKGLSYGSIQLSAKSPLGDSKVDILKIDPKYFSFEMVCAGEKKSDNKKVSQWAKENDLIATINAGMFKLDGEFKTCTGYMKNYKYINNPTMNAAYRNVMAYNPKDSTVPSAQIIDISCQDWNVLKNKYNSFSQGIRMMDCKQNNTWQLKPKKWSMVLIAEDKSGNMLFIFVRSPYRVHDFVNHLLGLSIGIKRLMYLEGGPEASFYLNHPSLAIEKSGSYETGFNENDDNKQLWDIPNVIGIKRKK